MKRFSPAQNLAKKERIPGPEIRMLLATDIVSEGQNLQDCARVLNYDLHWNPVAPDPAVRPRRPHRHGTRRNQPTQTCGPTSRVRTPSSPLPSGCMGESSHSTT